MSKYFYTDHLAAAWMSKHFGMKFVEGIEIKTDEGMSGIGDSPAHIRIYSGGWSIPKEFHVCPDSLHLLEPKHGDMVEYLFIEQGGGHVETIQYNEMWPQLGLNKVMIRCIAKRNGKHFMWPETTEPKIG